MGLIWLRTPTLWHSSRAAGAPRAGLTAAQKAMMAARWTNWYTADWDYGQTTLAFFCAGIALCALGAWAARFRSRPRANNSSSSPSSNEKDGAVAVADVTPPSALDRLAAALRYAGARQFFFHRAGYYSPPLAALVAVGVMFVFVMTLTLAARPFYWESYDMGHSPPLGTRAGWISIAIMPFMIAFSTKVNFVGLLAGTSHEKLQVFHRWTAVLMYITALVHTFPFIILDKRMGVMESQYATTSWFWTGIAALVPQTYLTALSWGVFRGPYYETFKKLHFIASGIFMAALFIHVNFRLTSWDYFFATAAIYTLAWLLRVLRTLYITGLGIPASVESAGPGLLRICVRAPRRFAWAPGQHVFVRFLGLGLHALSSHPFTVSSLHAAGAGGENTTEGEGENTVELVLRVHGGITRALAAKAAGRPAWTTRVVLDGPYGGLHAPLRAFERVYLLAGGSGATFTLPLLADLARSLKAGDAACRHVEFVVAARDHESYSWMEPAVVAATALVGDASKLAVRVHLTRSEPDSKADEEEEEEDDKVQAERCRPHLADIVHAAHRSCAGRVAIIACGPDSFLYDVRNAVAQCELVIVDGFGACRDLFLHTETYTW